MGFVKWTIDFFGSLRFLFFEFEGRIGRRAYFVGNLLLAISFFVFGFKMPGVIFNHGGAGLSEMTKLLFWLYIACVLLLHLWPSLAMAVKRCHDFGESLLDRIPSFLYFGFISIATEEGDKGENRYGFRRSL